MESKDLIRMENKLFYKVCEIACRVSRLDHWKIALESKKMKDSKLLKKEKKQFMANQDIELGFRYILNKSSFRDDELSSEEEDDKDEEELEAYDELQEEEELEEEEDKEKDGFFDFTSITERLVLRCSYANQIECQTFQGFMINELRWYLKEYGQKTKQIYPIVYPLANENEPLDTSFELQRNWKNFNNSFTKIESCLSGDLNGGYSDKIIYQLGKNGNSISEDDILKYSPSAIPISNFEYIDSQPSISATRPFHSNPDLFQVYLIFSNIEKRSNLETNKKIGFIFTFQFKIVEEFKLLKERLFERLKRNVLTDCKFEFQ